MLICWSKQPIIEFRINNLNLMKIFDSRHMENVRTIISGFIFFQLFSHVLFMSINLYQLNKVQFREQYLTVNQFNRFIYHFMQLIKNLSFGIMMSLNSLISQLVHNFVICYFANEVSVRSLDVADVVYDSMWYSLSIKNQKHLRTWIQRSQRSFFFDGFGIITCSMPTFLTVID